MDIFTNTNTINIQTVILQKKLNEIKKETAEYEKIYNLLLKEFNSVFRINKRELFFEIPKVNTSSPSYSYLKCLKYIIKQLDYINTKHVFSYLYSKNILYLYW